MAKSKKPQKDAHTSGFMVRLPEAYRAALQKLKVLTDRPITACVRRGVDAELRANGIEPPAAAQ